MIGAAGSWQLAAGSFLARGLPAARCLLPACLLVVSALHVPVADARKQNSDPTAPEDEDIIEGLPPWMEKGEEVRLAVARELLDSGSTIEALSIIRDMRAKGFDGPELDLLQGQALREDGLMSEAERLLLEARRKMGKDPRPSEELCLLYADLHRIDEAIEACKRATSVSSPTASAYNNLCFLLLAADRPAEALVECEKAVGLDGAEARYRNNLGIAQAANGLAYEAYRTFKSTMSSSDAAYMVGFAVERYSETEEAIKWYEKALKYEPGHAQAEERLKVIQEEGQDAAIVPEEEQQTP
jgi:tetratricopeptide (TPR) repeat protein